MCKYRRCCSQHLLPAAAAADDDDDDDDDDDTAAADAAPTMNYARSYTYFPQVYPNRFDNLVIST